MSSLKRFARSATCGLLLFAMGCGLPPEADGPEGTETNSAGVTAGTPTFARPEVGHFIDAGGGWCTGTLITERHVLTAAHCIDWQPIQKGGERGSFTIHVPPTGEALTFPVDRSVSIGFHTNSDPRDLAVARLVTPVPANVATPAAIANAPTYSGDLLTIIGYGWDGRGGGPGMKRTRSWTKTKHDRVLEGADSGGPIFAGSLESNGPIVFTGAATYHFPGYTDRDAYGDPVLFRDQIYNLVRAMESEGICYRYLNASSWSPFYCDGEPTPATKYLYGMQILPGANSGIEACFSACRTTGHPQYSTAWLTEVCDGGALTWGNPSAKAAGTLVNLRVRLASDSQQRSVVYYAHSSAYSGANNSPVVKEPAKYLPGVGIQNFAVWLVHPDR